MMLLSSTSQPLSEWGTPNMPAIKESDNAAIEAFLKAKRASDPRYGKVRPAKAKGTSDFMLERQVEQNMMMGFGPILDVDLSKKQKAAKRNVTFIRSVIRTKPSASISPTSPV